MTPIIQKLLYTKEGNIIISIILGIGLAMIFKPVCKNVLNIYHQIYIKKKIKNIKLMEHVIKILLFLKNVVVKNYQCLNNLVCIRNLKNYNFIKKI